MRQPAPNPPSLIQTGLLTVWLGAALFFGAVVAPTAFRVLPTPSLAGALIGQLLPTLFLSGLAVGLAVLVIELRWPRVRTPFRTVAAVIMIAACAAAQFVVGRQIARIRAGASAPIGVLPADDPRRVAFGRLHALSVVGLGVAMMAAAAAVATVRGAQNSGVDRGA